MKKVLIVDDDELVSKALRIRLQAQGFRVTVAFDAVGAVESAVEERPDVIILDINLPGGNGLIVAERLLEESVTTDLPVVFITAGDQPRLRERAAELSAVAFLAKPFEARELLDAIDLATLRTSPTAAAERAA